MGIFFGTYSRSLDEKNRLQIPSKLLSPLPSKLYSIRGYEGCLSIYLESDFLSLAQKLSSLSYEESKSRAYIRLALSSVSEMEIDSHGRLPLGKELIDLYHIGKNVIIIGVLDHFEIWDEGAYLDYQKKNSGEYEALAEDLRKGAQ